MRIQSFTELAVSPAVLALARVIGQPKRRVRENKAGDWIAYEGQCRVGSFGSNARRAREWAAR